MVRVLITAAEEEEIISAKQAFNNLESENKELLHVEYMLTGIGAVSTTYRLTKKLSDSNQKFDIIINCGIAGSFSDDFPIGAVARVEKEYFGDLGFETFGGFMTLFDYDILDADTLPFKGGALIAPRLSDNIESSLSHIKAASAVTVQTVSGFPEKRTRLIEGFHPQIESMEGAAFFYVAILEGVPFIELRSVSNDVGERDRSKWNIPLALSSLKDALRELLVALSFNN